MSTDTGYAKHIPLPEQLSWPQSGFLGYILILKGRSSKPRALAW